MLISHTTVWFKIKLTLFKTQIFHKWDSIMKLFEHFNILIKHDTLKWCCESGIEIDAEILKRGPFLDKQWKIKLQTRKTDGAVTIDVLYLHSCTDFFDDCAGCMMIPQYNMMPPIKLHRVYVRVKWFLTICQKRTPISPIISTSILMPLSPNPPKVSHVVNIVK